MGPIPLAFYAPLKPPDHPNPSGDRHLARLLMKALSRAGYQVSLAASFRSRDGNGDAIRQQRLRRLGERWARRLIRRYRNLPEAQRPRLWFTYHLYHKAPDWLGPMVSEALNIPYVVAEASYAPKQENGPWSAGVSASLAALSQARAILCLNPVDRTCIAEKLPTAPLHSLAPFLDLESLPLQRRYDKAQLARRWQLDEQRPWLVTVAMMRPGDKSESYRLLAKALTGLHDRNWQLIVIGDGRAGAEVRSYFQDLPEVHFLGRQPSEEIMPLLSCSDLCVWPAVNEAFGLSLLEAQAAGTAVLAGDEGGVASIVQSGITAELSRARDADDFSRKLKLLLSAPQRYRNMGNAARQYVLNHHSLDSAAAELRNILEPLT